MKRTATAAATPPSSSADLNTTTPPSPFHAFKRTRLYPSPPSPSSTTSSSSSSSRSSSACLSDCPSPLPAPIPEKKTFYARRDSGVSLDGLVDLTLDDCLAAESFPAPCQAHQQQQQRATTTATQTSHSIQLQKPIHFAPSKILVNLIQKQHLNLPNATYELDVQLGKWKPDTRQISNKNSNSTTETTYQGINYMDRYLSTTKTHRIPQLYLIATTCMYLAVQIQRGNQGALEIKKCEGRVLGALKWELSCVSPQAILNELLNSIQPTTTTTPSSFTQSIRDKIMKDAQPFFTIALSDIAFLKFQPATLVFTVLSMVAPGLFDMLDLSKSFRFDPNIVS
ncbi:hypothetical protein BDR26DRAFT_940997 [Obelidium mucronatum]|nr:hypothetical protein BDR26DRAFT_940997 [Obelidium mucronatum]